MSYELMRQCGTWNKCNVPLCPLDEEIDLRVGSNPCRWIKEEIVRKIGNNDVRGFGKEMPEYLLKFVPKKNIRKLNKASQNAYRRKNT